MTRIQASFSLEYILLGFLFNSPIHGYDLYKKISNLKGISIIWHIKMSQLYALLDKLEKEGLLTSRHVPGQALLIRKEFQMSPLGEQKFLAWVSTPVEHGREMRQEFLAKLYFAQKSGVEAYVKLIDEQILICGQWLSSINLSSSKLTSEPAFERLVFQYRIMQIKAMMEWLNYCRVETNAVFPLRSGAEE
jgi:PadR family transcriptional regulator, regulatory protein AphA